MSNSKHVAIIGAGASGCVCAYFLLKNGVKVTLYDKSSPLRTLLPTGGGRCNLAHAEFDPRDLVKNYPRGEKFLYSVFAKFSTYETLGMFEELGIETYAQDDGRIFPVSNSAKEVRHVILNKISHANIKRENVCSISHDGTGYRVNDGTDVFSHVVLALGGHAPLNLVKDFGLSIVEPKPSLVGLNTKDSYKMLSGTVVKDVVGCGFQGDILFTHFGISGPLIYKISSINAFKKYPYELELDLFPRELPLQDILNSSPHKEIKNILKEYFSQKLVSYLLEGISGEAHTIDGKTRDMILNRIHHFKVTVMGTNVGEETVTAGGIDLDEINSKTMCAKKIPNLYCIGEVLNIDGFCGGFNLQNAWSTAFVAAEAIANS
jgi:hypothetical protein